MKGLDQCTCGIPHVQWNQDDNGNLIKNKTKKIQLATEKTPEMYCLDFKESSKGNVPGDFSLQTALNPWNFTWLYKSIVVFYYYFVRSNTWEF